MSEQMMQQADSKAGEEVFTPDGARSQMQLPDELRDAYVRVVDAGLKLMFDPQTRDQTIAFMEGPGEPAQKLGEGVAAVMALLFKESNQTMPPQLVIPCGYELLLHAADVAKKGGMELDNNTVAEAAAIMVESVMKHFGVDPETGKMLSGGQEEGAEPEPMEQAEAAGVEQQEDMGNEEGLIKGAMR